MFRYFYFADVKNNFFKKIILIYFIIKKIFKKTNVIVLKKTHVRSHFQDVLD
jgi:hypothetical protein